MDILVYSSIGRLLLSTQDETNANEMLRIEHDAKRTFDFLLVFGLFSLVFCSLSYYMYTHPHDSPSGNSFASIIRRIPYLGWFWRQPLSSTSVSYQPISIQDKDELIELEDQNTLPEDNNIDNNETNTGNNLKLATSILVLNNDCSSLSNKDKNEDTTLPHGHNSIKNTPLSISPQSSLTSSKDPLVVLINQYPNLMLSLFGMGLLLAYLIWGFVQERIMGHPYGDPNDENNWFKSSEFIVLINRLFGLIVSSIIMQFSGPSGNDSPPFYLSICALSNMMSSWFQYESLHFVTFPVQTVFKSSKILITMGIGKLISNKSYNWKQYLSSIIVAIGVYIFLTAQRNSNKEDRDFGNYFYLGLALVSGYAIADAFTTNWQDKVFEHTKISSLEMMQGVNAFTALVSFLFCLHDLEYVYKFYNDHPLFIIHSVISGLCGGLGQVFIFYTIQYFGAVKFATIMTTRMVLSVLISIVYYGHEITYLGKFGMVITFIALFYQGYSKQGKGRTRTNKE